MTDELSEAVKTVRLYADSATLRDEFYRALILVCEAAKRAEPVPRNYCPNCGVSFAPIAPDAPPDLDALYGPARMPLCSRPAHPVSGYCCQLSWNHLGPCSFAPDAPTRQQDAARYRWLRENWIEVIRDDRVRLNGSGNVLDERVDDAMHEKQGEGDTVSDNGASSGATVGGQERLER